MAGLQPRLLVQFALHGQGAVAGNRPYCSYVHVVHLFRALRLTLFDRANHLW